MNITEDRTIGSLVAEQVGRARVFEWYGLDYCCGGKLSLSEACAARNIEPATVIEDLDKCDEGTPAANGSDLNHYNVAALIEEIIGTHHAYLRIELPRLSHLVAKIASVHGERHPSLIAVREIYGQLRDDLEAHYLEEEELLFPTLRLLASRGGFSMLEPDVTGYIAKMEKEHTVVGSLLERLKELTNGYVMPEDGCETYRVALHGLMTLEQDIHLHVHKENNILFPKVMSAVAA